jgi:hypothetical protein
MHEDLRDVFTVLVDRLKRASPSVSSPRAKATWSRPSPSDVKRPPAHGVPALTSMQAGELDCDLGQLPREQATTDFRQLLRTLH